MDLRVSALRGKYSVTEFHFRNSYCGHVPRVALTETLVCCYPAFRTRTRRALFPPTAAVAREALEDQKNQVSRHASTAAMTVLRKFT
jgi:hypothetical protein